MLSSKPPHRHRCQVPRLENRGDKRLATPLISTNLDLGSAIGNQQRCYKLHAPAHPMKYTIPNTDSRHQLTHTPQIGLTHGTQAKVPIARTIAFYTSQFLESAALSWPEVRALALGFRTSLQAHWPAYLDEIRGIAAGAGVDEADILAINVRTEITFGLCTDGCTALSWLTPSGGASWLAQNWDWMTAQKENLVVLTVEAEGKPSIKMVTEAGLMGKIGLNSAGVGVCLNAIRVRGMDATRLPCHLGLRMVLESRSREEAVARLEQYGIASSCHMLIADATGAVGLEWSAIDVQKLPMNAAGQIFHSNHYLAKHPGISGADSVSGGDYLGDSVFRVARIGELAKVMYPSGGNINKEEISGFFEDEANYPGAICRATFEGKPLSGTLFNIVMDLKTKTATVKLGRPTEVEETVELAF